MRDVTVIYIATRNDFSWKSWKSWIYGIKEASQVGQKNGRDICLFGYYHQVTVEKMECRKSACEINLLMEKRKEVENDRSWARWTCMCDVVLLTCRKCIETYIVYCIKKTWKIINAFECLCLNHRTDTRVFQVNMSVYHILPASSSHIVTKAIKIAIVEWKLKYLSFRMWWSGSKVHQSS